MSKTAQRLFYRSGPLNGKERFYLVVGTPLLLLILVVELVRVGRAFMGEPLLITSFTNPDAFVTWSSTPIPFFAGLLMHVGIMTFLAAALFFQVQQGRRWLSSRKKHGS